MLCLKKRSQRSDSDLAEIKVLRQMLIANDSMLTQRMISQDEYDRTLAYIEHRVSELEVRHGLSMG